MSYSKLALLGTILALSLVSVTHALPLDQNVYFSHIGDADPVTEGWTLNPGSGGTVSSGPGTETIGPNTYDYWFTNDSATAGGQFLNYSRPVTTAQYLNAWSLRTRVRVNDSSGVDQLFALQDETDRWGFWLLNGSLIDASSSGVLYSSDFNSDYREIELLYTPVTPGVKNAGDTVQFYVDQLLVDTQTRSDAFNTTNGPSIVFGASSSAGTGAANWSHVEFSEGAILGFAQEVVPVPEPGTGLLMLLGVAGLKLRRRNGR